jgi:hypothetical protein
MEKEKKNHLDGYTVSVYRNSVTVTVWVTPELKKKATNNSVFGDIEVSDGNIGKESVHWDNLEYFFKIGKEKKKELKQDLIDNRQWYEGWCKDLKWCMKEIKRLKLI